MCREGSNCRYRHWNDGNNEMSSSASSTNNVCRFFKHGICKFGNQCYFRHSTETTDNNLVNGNSVENSTEHASNISTSTTIKNM